MLINKARCEVRSKRSLRGRPRLKIREQKSDLKLKPCWT
jgi:hypothetical protein